MNLVDSSGWLEYFSDGPNANIFSEPLNDISNLIVPTICMYEVFKVILRERNDDDALQAIAVMQQGKIIELSMEISIQAAKNSLEFKIPISVAGANVRRPQSRFPIYYDCAGGQANRFQPTPDDSLFSRCRAYSRNRYGTF